MKTDEYFIYLVSCHLNGENPNGEKRNDWQQIYNLADKNGVSAIAAEVVKKLPEDCRPKGNILALFNQSFDAAMNNYNRKMKSLSAFLSALSLENIPHLLVKGAVLRNLYPEPALRTGGDIDVIVKHADYYDAAKALKSRGFEQKNMKDSEAKFEINGDAFEINTELESINIQSKIYFSTPFDDISESVGYTYKLKPLYHLLYVITHVAHHLKEGGAGIRMITDIDILIRNYRDIDIDSFLLLCENINIRKTAEALIALSKKWFSTPVAINFTFEDEDTRQLLKNLTGVITSGGRMNAESAANASDMSVNKECKIKKMFSAASSFFGTKKSGDLTDENQQISRAEKAIYDELGIKTETE